MRAMCLAQKHHALTPARCQTRTAWSGVQCTNQYIMIIRRLKWLCSHSLPKYSAWVWFSLGSTAVNPICPGEVCHVWTQHNFVLVPRHQCSGTKWKHGLQYAAMMSASRLGLRLQQVSADGKWGQKDTNRTGNHVPTWCPFIAIGTHSTVHVPSFD